MKNAFLNMALLIISIILINCGTKKQEYIEHSKKNEEIIDKVNEYLNKLEATGFSGTILVDNKGDTFSV